MNTLKTVVLLSSYASSLENFRGPLILEIVARGHRVVTLAPDFDANTRAAVEALGAETRCCPLVRTGINPLSDLKSILAMRSLLAELRPHVSLCYYIKPVIYGTLAASWAKVPHRVALIEGLGFTFTDIVKPLGIKRRVLRVVVSMLYRLALVRAHQVLMLNPDDVREFVERGLVAPRLTQCIGGIGVDLTEWPETPLLSLSEQPITFTLAGRLLREKGIREFVGAARVIKARYPNTRFMLLGGLDENPGAIPLAEVQSWVDGGVLEWPGHVPMRPWLEKTHIYVLPSYREGVPRSTQEAMALGRAVITTDAPGCRETVVPGENGFLVPVRNVPALIQSMERFIKNPDLISTMGKASRRLAEERFDVQKTNAKIIAALGL